MWIIEFPLKASVLILVLWVGSYFLRLIEKKLNAKKVFEPAGAKFKVLYDVAHVAFGGVVGMALSFLFF